MENLLEVGWGARGMEASWETHVLYVALAILELNL